MSKPRRFIPLRSECLDGPPPQLQRRHTEGYCLSASTMHTHPMGIPGLAMVTLEVRPMYRRFFLPRRMRITSFVADPVNENCVQMPCESAPILLSSVRLLGDSTWDGSIMCGGAELDGLGAALTKAIRTQDFAAAAKVLSGHFTRDQLGLIGASVDKALDLDEPPGPLSNSLDMMVKDWRPISVFNPLQMDFQSVLAPGMNVHVFVTLEGDSSERDPSERDLYDYHERIRQ